MPYAARWPVEVHLAPAPRRARPRRARRRGARRAGRGLPATCCSRLDRYYVDAAGDPIALPYIAGWHQAPVREGRDVSRLHLQVMSVLRAPGKLKYLAGSESGVGGWVNDVTAGAGRRAAARGRARRVTEPDGRRPTLRRAVRLPPPDGRVVGARPGQPHRRAHRLQRRALPADRAAAAHLPSRVRLRRDRTVRVWSVQTGEQVDRRPRRRRARAPRRAGRRTSPASSGPWSRRGTRWPALDVVVDGRVPLGAGPVQLGRARVRRRRGAVRPVRPRPAGTTTPARARLAAVCADAENTIARAPDRRHGPVGVAALHRRPRDPARLPRRLGRAGAVRPGRARPRAAGHGHPRRARAGRRPVRRSGARSCEQAAAELGVASLREVAVRLPRRGAGDGSSDPVVRRRARHVVTEIERVRRDGRRSCARTGSRRSARCSTPRTPRCATTSRSPCAELDVAVETARGARRARRPDDRRRVRRLGHRDRAGRVRSRRSPRR